MVCRPVPADGVTILERLPAACVRLDQAGRIANLVFLRDDTGRPLCWLGQFQDITARRRREERLGHRAVHDELTNVANRRGLMQELEQRTAHARRYDEPGALLVPDIDGFRAINDRDAHPRETGCSSRPPRR